MLGLSGGLSGSGPGHGGMGLGSCCFEATSWLPLHTSPSDSCALPHKLGMWSSSHAPALCCNALTPKVTHFSAPCIPRMCSCVVTSHPDAPCCLLQAA